MSRLICCALLLWVLAVTAPLRAEPATALPTAPSADRWIDPEGLPGGLVIAGGGELPEQVFEAFKRMSGDEPSLVVITTASARAGDESTVEKTVKRWNERGFDKVAVLHTNDRETADSEAFCEPLKQATAVWFEGGQQSRLAEAYVGTRVEKAILEVIQRGGVVGGTSAGAAIQSELMIASGKPPKANLLRGLPLLPDAVVDQHFTVRKRKSRLAATLAAHPGRFGVGIDENTAIVVRGRFMRAIGDGMVTLLLPAGAGREAVEKQLQDRQIADLTSLRRAARDRQNGVFPPQKSRAPQLKNGSLMIVGGGGMPTALVKRFIELAGGPDAKIVVMPTAMGDPLPPPSRFSAMFTRQGAKNVVVLRQRKRDDVQSEEFKAALKDAGGVWFGGGRQWRFMDAYEQTQAQQLFHDVLKRGGIIGGSSAGASIQAEYMVRGNPLGNQDMMAWGYERGLDFLGGVAVDQHFTQRRRHNDLKGVIERHPQLLGIGIDETTAIVVTGKIAEVAGRHDTYFLTADDNGKVSEVGLPAGGKYDLVERKVVFRPEPPESENDEASKKAEETDAKKTDAKKTDTGKSDAEKK